MINALLLSNSTMPGTSFFTWPKSYVKDFLGKEIKNLVFIPYAAVTISFDEYAERVSEVFKEMGFSITSIHAVHDAHGLLRKSHGILVGGGNSFALLHRLQVEDLMTTIYDLVQEGKPYVGWSAGANLACPTIMTTNDMPIIHPQTLEGLGLIPLQINPHYHELKFEGQGGETRRERLEEFLVLNPDKKVIGLPEGMLLQRIGDKLTLSGTGVAKLYQGGKDLIHFEPGTDLSYLL